MIKYKPGIIDRLRDAGYKPQRIRDEKIFGESNMTDFRRQAEIPYKTLNRLCAILHCRIEDVIEYVPDEDNADAQNA